MHTQGMIKRAAGLAALACVMAGAPAAAQYPDRPIKYILSSAPGSGPDNMVRALVSRLSAHLGGVSIVVENRPGAGGLIAMNALANASPDGYTIGHGNIQTMAISPGLAQASLAAIQGIDYIGLIGTAPNFLLVGPSISADVRSVQDLVAHAKKHAGKLSYASGGNGTSHHLGMELFKQISQIDLLHVPYKSTSVGVADLAGKRVDLMMDGPEGPSASLATPESGIRRLAVTSARRLADFPDVPTMAEAGVTDYEVVAWSGLIAPKGMAADKVERINTALRAVLKEPDFVRFLRSSGYEPRAGSPADFRKLAEDERAKWGGVIRAIGMATN